MKGWQVGGGSVYYGPSFGRRNAGGDRDGVWGGRGFVRDCGMTGFDRTGKSGGIRKGTPMRRVIGVLVGLVSGVIVSGCGLGLTREEQQMKQFLDRHVAQVRPLEKATALAWWEAATTGKDEAYQRSAELQVQINEIYADREAFEELKALKATGKVSEPRLARQLDILYRAYLANQIDPELMKAIVDLSTQIEQRFSTFRGTIDGRQVSDNEIRKVLKTSRDSEERRKAWLASKQVGPAIAEDIRKLAHLRNRAARSVGFENFHTMRLELGEQPVAQITALFEELDRLTVEPFKALKADLDARLAARYGIGVDQLRPWHYHDPFFQETPLVYAVNLDKYYQGQDVIKLAREFYGSIGLDVGDILARSDLFERPGKNPHAFCTDIDRTGDVRILCNVVDNEQWMETVLHELGHGVYDKYYDPGMPFLLRGPTHAFTTEGIAMFFGRLSRNPAWMQAMLGLSDADRKVIEPVAAQYARAKQLIFARWAMVMFNFETRLYADPDQDLNTLWWDLVERYQLVHRPEGRDEPDWAAKIHIASSPCYYHNYLLGELFASQVRHRLVTEVLKQPADATVGYVGQKAVGAYLRKHVFEPGRLYSWNEMIRRATGEPLGATYFAEQFVK